MEQVFQGVIDRTRVRLNVKRLKTLFGMKTRPYRDRKGKAPRCEVVVETPSYDLTICNVYCMDAAFISDEHYEAIRQDMFTLMEDLRIAA